MRKIIGIIVCLLITVGLWAVEYHPATFSSTSAYMHESRVANVAAQSAMRPSGAMAFRSGAITTTGSLSAISASNFETLNSEGGACYTPARHGGTIRRGRSDEGEEGTSIGDLGYHSPVGATPCLFLALLAALYVVYKRPRSRASSSR